MKILSQERIDKARDLIISAMIDLVAAHRIVVNAYGSHLPAKGVADALNGARRALLNIAMTKLPASARSPKLKRMEGMARADESRNSLRRAKLEIADTVRVDWYERYRRNAMARFDPVMPFPAWLAREIERNGGVPRAAVERPRPRLQS